MAEGFVEPFFHCFHKYLFPLLVQKAPIEILVKVATTQSMFVQNFKDHSVYNNGLEYLGYVKTQRITSFSGSMKKAYRWIELSLMDGPKCFGITHHISKGY